MSDAALATTVDQGDQVSILQGNAILLATVAQIVAAPMAAVAATNASVTALAQRVAALEGKPDPCVALSGSMAVAGLVVGTSTVAVQVTGLLPTDRISVQPATDLPAGLSLGWSHPSPTAPGVMIVSVSALVALTGKPAVTLNVTALR